MPEEEDAIEELIAGKADLDYTVAIEIVPAITLADFKTIKLDKPVARSPTQRSMRRSRASPTRTSPFAPKAEGGKAESGDRVDDHLHRHHRRRAVRGRHRRRHRRC